MGRFRGLDVGNIELKDVNFSHLPKLKRFVKPFRWYLLLALALAVAISLLSTVGPLLVRRAIDVDIPSGDFSQLSKTALTYLGIMFLIEVLSVSQRYVMSWTGQHMLYSMRRALFSHLQDLGLDFYDKLQAGRIMSRVTSDVESLNQLISSGVLGLLTDLVTLVAIMAIMIQMNLKLALATLTVVPLLFLVVWTLRTRMTRAYHLVRRRIADIAANLQESISGMKIVQAFSREELNAEKFSDTNYESFQAQLEAARLHALFHPMVDIISAFGSALIVYYGGLRMAWNDPTVTVGTIVAFLNYMTRFFWPIRNLTEVYNLILQAGVSSERVFEILDTEPNVKDKQGAIELGKVQGHVKFNNVVFGYEPGLPVLHGISLEARPNETIALVGPTGAGKSSIINLLCRFYDVDEGEILVDGIDIRDVTVESLRRNMGIVLQDTFIFSGTVRDNIRYGRLDATDEEVERAAKIVGAHDFIMRLPDGYDTEVRERGSRLSVGQRQLLSFARALLADPRILILDEATSSVDAYTEYLIQKALEKLFEGRTSIVIAHRLSTIRNADRIYVIQDGRVAEVGNHEELMAKGGLYKSLYEKQFAGAPLVDEDEVPETDAERSDEGSGVPGQLSPRPGHAD
ncbi:MAG: ABC transporter ATP-binding protein [Bacillota bacterium]|nr:ABC transporter ATP-binding protein [Candidatus Fermentithermobacillaceae bacterium]HAF67047.1 ABC transporter ATP-binding protein [Clostridiales bacterium UBA9857]HOA70807.1 ABC transporter ATP-binding protein [Bacillota bacterium]HOP70539.1 ABC transporter ATP-binding protein [Bacillota bacterium]HPT35880.1 ABC transporter ATP-binding protein [Bacillota bacterium]